MCGRYTNHLSWTEIVELYDLTEPGPALNLPVRSNIAPTQDVPFIANQAGRRVLKLGRWWLVPHWAKELPKYAMFNARSENAASKPAFRDAFKHRRCLIPATGYYEWTKAEDGGKDPHLIQLPQASKMVKENLGHLLVSKRVGREFNSSRYTSETP